MIKYSLIYLFSSLLIVNSEVIQLTAQNISQYLQNHVTFVKFYSNWCPHSKRFEPVWKQFAQIKQNKDVHVAKVDCSRDPLLCSDHDVFGYPTVKLFVRGSGARYEGPREINSLESFYQEKIAEDSNFEDQITTKKSIVQLTTENFQSETKEIFSFVVFIAPWCRHCQEFKPTFQELAKQMANHDKLIFGIVDCTVEKNLCTKNAIRGYPTLIWFENGIEKDRYLQDRQISSLKSYIENLMKETVVVPSSSPPTIPEQFEETTENPVEFDNLLTTTTFTKATSFEGYAFVNFGASWCSHCQKLLPIWNQLSQKFANIPEIHIARVDCTTSESLCRDYGIRAFPTMILFRYGESKVEYNGSRDLKSFYQFLLAQLTVFGDDDLLNTDQNQPEN